MYKSSAFILLVLLGFSVASLANLNHNFYTKINQYDKAYPEKEEKSSKKENTNDSSQHKNETMTGVWISYLELQEFSQKYEVTEHNYRKFISNIYDNCVFYGINHVFVHIRPFSDALYPSKLYPWSNVLTGTQGQNPGFDPLKIMVEEAHNRNLYFHAWINPYRVTNNDDVSQLSPKSTITMWINSDNNRNVLKYNEKYYLNPAKKEVQEYILAGVTEIIEQYAVDGIHFDDYFYPSFTTKDYNMEFDALEYSVYKRKSIQNKKTLLTIPAWRRNQVSQLIKSIHKQIAQYNEKNRTNILFGISPVGNLDCLRSDYQYYVDIDKFMKSDQYIDYVCPQIYWGFQNPEAPFQDVLNQWCQLSKNSSVQLIVGLPVYKVGMNEESFDTEEFQDAGIIDKMINVCKKQNADGIIYYRYNDMIKIKQK